MKKCSLINPVTNHYTAVIKVKRFEDGLDYIAKRAGDVIERLNLTVVNQMHHLFPVRGITLAYVLSQSHLVVHTWPENNVAHIDVATCVDLSQEEFTKALENAFGKDKIEQLQIKNVS